MGAACILGSCCADGGVRGCHGVGLQIPLMGPLHVALCCGWARVQVSRHSFGCQDGAPFEKTTSDSFEECGDVWAMQGLMIDGQT
jgi:hypothetical protein